MKQRYEYEWTLGEHSLSAGVGTYTDLLCAAVISDEFWRASMKPCTLTQCSFFKYGSSIQNKFVSFVPEQVWVPQGYIVMLKGIIVMKHTDASSVPHLLLLLSCLGIEPRYLTIHLPAVIAGSLFWILVFMMFFFWGRAFMRLMDLRKSIYGSRG